MSDDVLDVVRRTIRRRAMLAGGETVLVAVSGGADSTALLHVLVALAPEYRLQLHVLHVDHGLRADSARDADAVQRLAGRLGVPVEVARVAVEPRGSIEAAAREARYAALEARADAVGAHRIAVGHTGDDQAETVLMRLLEGAGLRGLAAIPPTRGRVIRPLLDVRCADLRAWLGRAGLSWIDDPTNRDPKFLRNRVRHELLPALRALHGADVSAALIRVARQARGALETIERLAAAELERWASVETDVITLPRSAVAALPPDVAVEVLRQAATRVGGHAPLRAWAHRALRRALADPPPRRPQRVGGVLVDASGAQLRIARGPAATLLTHLVPVPGRVTLAEVGLELEAREFSRAGYAIPRDPRRVAFDADALGSPLIARRRRSGDRFQPFGAPSPRRLKTFLIDAKVARWDRDRLPVVEAGGDIVWVGGLRRGAQAPVTPTSRRVIELSLKPLAKP